MTSANGAVRADAKRLRGDADRAARHGRDAIDHGKQAIPELVAQARELFGERLDSVLDQLRDRGGEAQEAAEEGFENARVYLVDRAQERPVASTLAILGAGFLLGLLLAGSRK